VKNLQNLTLLLLIGVVALVLYLTFQQSEQRLTMADALRKEFRSEIQDVKTPSLPDKATRDITQQMDYLKLRQDAVIDEARNSIQRQSTVFGTVAAFFGLFTVFFGYRQLLNDARGSEARDKYDQEMRSLVKSFQDNIQNINSLITTLEKTFDYRKQIADELAAIQDRARLLESHKAEADKTFDLSLAHINRKALTVVPLAIDRAALNYEENRRTMEVFASEMDALERARDIQGKLNPFCYYVRGLSKVTTYQYKLAIDDFRAAALKAREDIAEPKIGNYALEHRDGLKDNLSELFVSCNYFQGVCRKNLGQYAEGAKCFRDALERNPRHYDSLAYLLQLMYFDDSNSFGDVEAAFEKASKEVESRLAKATEDESSGLRHSSELLMIYFGDIYHAKLICPEHRSGYRRYENPEKAIQQYWKAYKLAPGDLATFSLAQAMEQVGSSHWGHFTPRQLYETTFTDLKRRVASDYDKLYSVTLYYMLAVCATKLPEGFGVAEIFLSQARHSLKEVPTDVTCFSPISRVRLTRPQILEELETFERLSREGAIHVS